MIFVFNGRFAVGQPLIWIAQFGAQRALVPPPPPPGPSVNFYVDNCLVRRDDKARYWWVGG